MSQDSKIIPNKYKLVYSASKPDLLTELESDGAPFSY